LVGETRVPPRRWSAGMCADQKPPRKKRADRHRCPRGGAKTMAIQCLPFSFVCVDRAYCCWGAFYLGLISPSCWPWCSSWSVFFYSHRRLAAIDESFLMFSGSSPLRWNLAAEQGSTGSRQKQSKGGSPCLWLEQHSEILSGDKRKNPACSPGGQLSQTGRPNAWLQGMNEAVGKPVGYRVRLEDVFPPPDRNDHRRLFPPASAGRSRLHGPAVACGDLRRI